MSLIALTNDSIIAVSAGFGASGIAAIGATIMGNQIANTVETEIKDSTVSAGGDATMSAGDTSSITSLGLSFAGSGGIALSVIAAINDIGNTSNRRSSDRLSTQARP